MILKRASGIIPHNGVNKKLKYLFLLSNLFFYILVINSQQPPLIINNYDKVIDDISRTISRNLPSGIEILMYDINIMNEHGQNADNMKKEIENLFISKNKEYNFKIRTPKDISTDMSVSDILNNYPSEKDLMDIAGYLRQDAVLLVNITLIKNETRNVWSARARAIQRKNIYLMQANLFKPDTHSVLLRFYNFFYFEQL